MKKWDPAQHFLMTILAIRKPQPALMGIGRDIGMGEHGAFWRAGGPAGILQQGYILRRINGDGVHAAMV